MDREAYFISKIQDSKVSCRLDDDGILLDNKFVYVMDLFHEDVHFTRKHFSYYQIAKKALLVNISDIFAMGAVPSYMMLGISFPNDMSMSDINEFQSAIIDVCNEYNIKIIGGDTIKSSKLNIGVSIFGKVKSKLITRRGFKKGDVLFFTGSLGSVFKDMRTLYRGYHINSLSKFYVPKIHHKFIMDISSFIGGGMDISDGLYYELNRISKLNNVAFRFHRKITRQEAISGEEYEFLFSVSQKYIKKIKMLARKHRVKLNKIATISHGRRRFHCPPHHM